jgi:hypothetical protein
VVEVERGSSGAWWRMKYRGQVDYLPDEPTEGDMRLFRESVDAAARRAECQANLPAIPVDRKTEADYL